MQESYTFKILKQNQSQVIVELDEELLRILQQQFPIRPIPNREREIPLSQKKMHNFQRRIVPFFMNQFMHWAEDMGYKQVDGYLRTIHRKKTSKQQKFELGDLKKLFGQINPRTKLIQTETQYKWIEFLKDQAEISVLLNNKIKDQETKQLYVDAIKSLKEELKKEQPYDKFLSLANKEPPYDPSQTEELSQQSPCQNDLEIDQEKHDPLDQFLSGW